MNHRLFLMNYGLMYGTFLLQQSLERIILTQNQRVTRQKKREITRLLKVIPEIVRACQITKRLKTFKVVAERKHHHNSLRSWLLTKRGLIGPILKKQHQQRVIKNRRGGGYYENDYGLILGTFLIIHCLNNIIGWLERLTRSQIQRLMFLSLNILPKLVGICNEKRIFKLTSSDNYYREIVFNIL